MDAGGEEAASRCDSGGAGKEFSTGGNNRFRRHGKAPGLVGGSRSSIVGIGAADVTRKVKRNWTIALMEP